MAFELWDAETANLVGAYATEDEAMAVVREALHAHGSAYVETLFLGYENARGHSRMIADGKTLVMRASTNKRKLTNLPQRSESRRTKMAG